MNDLHVLQIAEHMSCDAAPTKQQCSCGMHLSTLSDTYIPYQQAFYQGPSTNDRPPPV